MPPDDDLHRKIDLLQHHCATLLLLSGINLLTNVLTICAAFLISWR